VKATNFAAVELWKTGHSIDEASNLGVQEGGRSSRRFDEHFREDRASCVESIMVSVRNGGYVFHGGVCGGAWIWDQDSET
jgi:hypothetical protein